MAAQPPLTLKQVRTIEAVARSSGLAQAAELLNSTHSVISRTLAAAEKGLGFPVFQRGWHGTEPTSMGEAVIGHCAQVLRLIRRAEADIKAIAGKRPNLVPFIKWHHLEAVAETVRYGSTKQAGHALGISQPAVSRAIAELTEYAHQNLFLRRRNGLAATPQARQLADLRDDVWQVLKRIGEPSSSATEGPHGRLAVGLLPFSGQDLVARAFGVLTRTHPNLRLMAVPGSYEMLSDALVRGEIDCILGILRYPPKYAELTERFLYKENYVLVARHDHSCHAQKQTMLTLKDEKWLVGQHGTPIRAYFEGLFESEGAVPPTQTCEIHSFGQAEQVIINSDSIGLLAYSPAHLRQLPTELARVDVDLPDTSVDIGMTTHRSNSPQDIIGIFDAALRPFLPD